VKVVCLLTEGEEQGQTVTKVSMRSKGGNGPTGVDVNEAARKLGGGGHVRAAGARVRASLVETKRRVLEILREQL
jgi:phosphoesterase RecJ-like protein